MKKEYKQMIPNLLTIIRIILTPIMIILSFLGHLKIVIVLAIIAALTDMIDGKLARYWNVTSLKGAKLDAVADKVFAIGLIACLIPNNKNMLILLILEAIIAVTNLFYHYKTKRTESLMIGKFKTTFLFITIICSFINTLTNHFDMLESGFKMVTINLQFLSLIFYFLKFYEVNHQKEITVENNITHQKIMEEIEEDKTIKIDNLVELTKKYNLNDLEDDDIY